MNRPAQKSCRNSAPGAFQPILKFLFLALAGALSVTATAQSSPAAKPNILYITIDDLNDYLSILGGHPQVSTPNMDRLARRGTVFTNAYCSSPICATSRTALFTGKNPEYTGIYNSNQYNAISGIFREIFNPALDIYTFPELLKDSAGYYTYSINKTFHGESGEGPPPGYDKDFYPADPDPCDRRGSWSNLIDWGNICSGLNGGSSPNCRNDGMDELFWGAHIGPNSRDQRSTDSALAFIQRYSDDPAQFCDRPFFLNVGLWRPHYAWFAPEQYFSELYEADVSSLDRRLFNHPPNADPPNGVVMPPQPAEGVWADTNTITEIGLLYSGRIHPVFLEYADTIASPPLYGGSLSLAERQDILEENKRAQAVLAYIACVQWVDDLVGSILDELEAHPALANNTVIVITSDHGYALGEKTDWAKPDLWEMVGRVPMIIMDPRVEGGHTCERTVSLIDIFPTMLDIAGLSSPLLADGSEYVDGKSLLPLTRNPLIPRDRPALMSFRRPSGGATCFPHYSLRSERFHYIEYRDNGIGGCDFPSSMLQQELYELGIDRSVDPEEWNNLASDPAYAQTIESLRQYLPGGPRYRNEGFRIEIDRSLSACAYAPGDTMELPLLYFDASGNPASIPAGTEARWTVFPGGVELTGESLAYPLPLTDSLGKITVNVVLRDTLSGIMATDVREFFRTTDLPNATFNPVIDAVGVVSIQSFMPDGPKPLRVEWLYSDGWVSTDSIAPDHRFTKPDEHEIIYRAWYSEDCFGQVRQEITITDSILAGAGCQSPYPIETSQVDYDRFRARWFDVYGATQYQARIREVKPAAESWSNLPVNPTNTVAFSNLGQDRTYEIAVRAACDPALAGSALSDWSISIKTTTKACRSPFNLRAEVPGSTEAVIRWDRPDEASSVDMVINNLSGGGSLFLTGLTVDSFTSDAFPAGSDFLVRTRSVCPSDFGSPYRAESGTEARFSTPSLKMLAEASLPFEIYPNPASSELRFDWNAPEQGTLEIVDMTGRPVWTGNPQSGTVIDVQYWPAGLYSYQWQPEAGQGPHASASFVIIR